MKYQLLSITLLCYCFSFAQLTVRNANFIYSENIVLYVENDVSIKESASHIYLRNDSQLIQGTSVTGNSGIGKLSVFQKGTVHNFAYNYWCSPVGNILADNALNRPFKANNQFYDYTGGLDPVDPTESSAATFTVGHNGSSSPLEISSRWLYTFDPGTVYSEWDFVAETGDVNTGYGFTMKGTSGSGSNQLYDFRGKPNNGTITTSVLLGEQTLVGNPYPSALDTRAYIWDTTNKLNINGTLYFWEQDLSVNSHYVADYVGGYATYTINESGPVTETFTPATFDTYNSDGSFNTTGSASSSGKQVKRYIPIGQGFMIEGTDVGVVRTTNAMRVFIKEGSQSEFFKTSNKTAKTNHEVVQYTDEGLAIIPDAYKRFRINVDFNNVYTRQLVHNFHDSATQGFDYGIESKSPENVASDAYWILDDVPYVAQANRFNEDLRIPLVLTLAEDKSIRFRIFDIQHFENSQSIYIYDNLNDIYVDLRQQNYDINLLEGNYNDRFEIVFRAEALSTEEFNDEDFLVIQNNNTSQLTILNPNQLEVKSVTLFDVSGKRIFNELNLEIQDRYSFSTKNLSDGVYITKVTFTNHSSMSKRVIVVRKN